MWAMALRTMAPVFLRKADDDKAFERLYERHVRDVYRYAAAMLGAQADAEDVTQTTFLNAYRAFKSGTRPEKPQSWLIAIAHNVCRQRFRQSQRRPQEVEFDENAGNGEPLEDPSTPTPDDLRRALSQLPPNQRAAIVMRELKGYSYAEIAEVLGISVSALETLLFRARRSLREQLEEQITCQEAALAINKQLDGRLSFAERRALRAHLRACDECSTLARSQRAQRRALKALVLIPIPATMSHWFGNQTAAAATGGAAAGTSSVVFGGAAAKVAAVVAAGVVVGGGTYEGVKHVGRPAHRAAKPHATVVHRAPATPAAASASPVTYRTFETPKAAAPVALTAVPKSKARAAKAAVAGGQSASRAPSVPPGQIVKTIAQIPQALRSGPPGQVAKALRAATPSSTSPGKRVGQTQHQTRRTHPAHSATPSDHVPPGQSDRIPPAQGKNSGDSEPTP
jgi:RNA polymerase sigma factor (sigma-70 family)